MLFAGSTDGTDSSTGINAFSLVLLVLAAA
jgi:hypothetical protein